MQKLDRLSKLGIVAIVVLVVFGGAGIWWWSQQPLEPAKAGPPPVMTPVPMSPTKSNEEREVEKAFQAFLAYQDASMEVTRTASDEDLAALQRLATPDGPQRERDADLVRQLRDGDVRVVEGAPKLVGDYATSEVDLSGDEPGRVTFDSCWDYRSVRTRNGSPATFGHMRPVMHLVDDEWLVHELTTEQVDSCPA